MKKWFPFYCGVSGTGIAFGLFWIGGQEFSRIPSFGLCAGLCLLAGLLIFILTSHPDL